jgi:hyperosmotically inducible periplasmic protein
MFLSGKEKIMNTRSMLTLCTVLVIGGALITGSAHAGSMANDTSPITDTWLTATIKIALFANARIKGSDITVETSQGVVSMRGKVDSDTAKLRAEGIANGFVGVTSVRNDLQVIAPSLREVSDDQDEAITSRVAAQIAKDSHLQTAGIVVQTFAGVVSLSGEIADLDQCSRIMDGVAGPRREISEERSHRQGEGLRAQSPVS